MATHRVIELAKVITDCTAAVNQHLTDNGFQTPTLDASAPARLPIDPAAIHVEHARQAVVEAADELSALMRGPAELLRVGWTDNVALHAIVRFSIPQSFAVGEETTFTEISHKTGVDERNIRRLLRHGMTKHLFTEPRKGFVEHTGLTKLLAEDAKTVDALQKWPGSEEPHETGFSLANSTTKSMWQVYDDDPARREIFGRGMSGVDKLKGYEPSLLHNGYPWAEKGAVVDVGGSHGTVMINLVRAFPHLKCVVQDRPSVVEEGKEMLPGDVEGRVDFVAHDFFTDQPVSADVYYMRSILHNWSDKYSVQILRHLTPALKPGARVLVHELVLPEPGTVSKADEKRMRSMDIAMLQLLNSYQRDAEEWQALFRAADRRWKFIGITQPQGAAQSLIEAAWEP